MGTRNFIAIKKRRQQKQQKTQQNTGVFSKTEKKLAEAYVRENFVVWQYNQWDGYFKGQGLEIFKFLRKFLDKWSDEQRREYIDNLDFVQEWTEEDNHALKNWSYNSRISDEENLKDPKFLELMPASIDCGYFIFYILDIKKGQVKTSFADCDWPLNGMFCQYGYIVDFDKSELHVLFSNDGNFESCKLLEPLEEIYGKRGLVVSTTFKFSELPRTADEFVKIVTKNAGEEESEDESDNESEEDSKKESEEESDEKSEVKPEETNDSNEENDKKKAGECDLLE